MNESRKNHPIDIQVISDIAGTLTDFREHITAEEDFFHSRAISALMEFEGLDKEQAKQRYEELLPHSMKGNPDGFKSDPLYKSEFCPIVSKCADEGYRSGALNMNAFLRPGAREFLEYLSKKDKRIILVSLSQVETTRTALRTAGLERYVGPIYCSSDLGNKETGEAFSDIAKEQKLELFDCMYLDDKLRNVLGARTAGIGTSIWVAEPKDSDIVQDNIFTTSDFKEIKERYELHVRIVYDCVVGPMWA